MVATWSITDTEDSWPESRLSVGSSTSGVEMADMSGILKYRQHSSLSYHDHQTPGITGAAKLHCNLDVNYQLATFQLRGD